MAYIVTGFIDFDNGEFHLENPNVKDRFSR
jgi:hypothetical protein